MQRAPVSDSTSYFCSCVSFTVKTAIPSYIIGRGAVLRVGTVISVPPVDVCLTDFNPDAVELSGFYFQRLKFRRRVRTQRAAFGGKLGSHRPER